MPEDERGKESYLQVRIKLLKNMYRSLQRRMRNAEEEKAGLKQRAEAWERKAREQHKKIQELHEHIKGNHQEMQRLRSKCSGLKTSLSKQTDLTRQAESSLTAAQAKIFDLQPYRRELPQYEVSRDYQKVVDAVEDLVSHLLEPWQNIEGSVREVALSSILEETPSNIGQLQTAIGQHQDLIHAATWPDMDEDIITSLVMRHLNVNLFKTELYNRLPHYVDQLELITKEMSTSTEPKRDPLTIRNWKAEAFNAIFSSPHFDDIRRKALDKLTTDLVGILGVFIRQSRKSQLYHDLRKKCVQPAAELYEKIEVSSVMFSLFLPTYAPRDLEPHHTMSPESRFYLDFPNLDCRDAVRSMKKFVPDCSDPHLSVESLRESVQNVCSVVPALIMTASERSDSRTVIKQRNVVACGTAEDISEHREKGEITWVSLFLGAQVLDDSDTTEFSI